MEVTSCTLLVLNSLEAGKWFLLLSPSPSLVLYLPNLLLDPGADTGDYSQPHSPIQMNGCYYIHSVSAGWGSSRALPFLQLLGFGLQRDQTP